MHLHCNHCDPPIEEPKSTLAWELKQLFAAASPLAWTVIRTSRRTVERVGRGGAFPNISAESAVKHALPWIIAKSQSPGFGWASAQEHEGCRVDCVSYAAPDGYLFQPIHRRVYGLNSSRISTVA